MANLDLLTYPVSNLNKFTGSLGWTVLSLYWLVRCLVSIGIGLCLPKNSTMVPILPPFTARHALLQAIVCIHTGMKVCTSPGTQSSFAHLFCLVKLL